jgi:4-amino-4-deoxy-L-arabinose transferase-like glycosyltransferase
MFFAKLGDLPLANYDDCYYAQKAKEMVQTGDYLTPHFAGQPRFDNPPLYLWLTALNFRVFGISNTAAIFWSALSGVFSVVLLHRIALRLTDPATALWAGICLLCTQYFLKYGRHAMFDVLLTALFLVALHGYLRARDGAGGGFLQAGIASGLGILTKSVLGTFAGAVIVLHVAWERRWSAFRSPWFWGGVGSCVAVVSPWFVQQYLVHGTSFLDEHFRWLLWHRAFQTEGEDVRGPLYYLQGIARVYWPWLPFAVLGLGMSVRRSFRDGDPTARLVVLWVVVVIGTMSIARDKKLWYIMQAFPGLALASALVLGRWFQSPRRYAWLQAVAFPLLLAVALTFAIGPFELSLVRQPGVHAMALAARKVVPDGEPVLNWGYDLWSISSLFLYYSDHRVTEPLNDETRFRELLQESGYGLIRREDYEAHFAGSLVPVAEEAGVMLVTGGSSARPAGAGS